jgi:hypothetical protein
MPVYNVTDLLQNGRIVTLDSPLPLAEGKVRVSVEPLEQDKPMTHAEVIDMIRESQRQRGHTPPTKEEVDEYLRQERDSWGDCPRSSIWTRLP